MKLSMLEIIKDMVRYYTKDPVNRRAVQVSEGQLGETCRYEADDGRRCAIGRCMTAEGLADYKDREISAMGINDELVDGLDKVLQPKYRGHSIDFWSNLQDLHDGKGYWEPEGLTKMGKEEVSGLRNHWS